MGHFTPFSSLLPILTFFFLLHQSSSTPVTTINDSSHTGLFSKIYAFGDSYTDTGNTASATGPTAFTHVSRPPYGMTYFRRPTNRYSDGRLVVDFLAETLSLPFLPPYRDSKADFSHGVNFAVAGSTALDYEFYVRNNATVDSTPQSLQTQLGWFEKVLEGKGCGQSRSRRCRMAMKDALFWVGEIGANDYAYAFASGISSTTVQDLAIKNVHGFLQALLKKGAKYIVVEGLPLTGCLPLALYLAPPNDRDSTGCVASENHQVYTHNARLQETLQQLRRQFPKAFISYANFWNAHLQVMKNPSRYGFEETLKTCCGSGGGLYNFEPFSTCGSPSVPKACVDPAKFVNWDGVHLTDAMHKAVAHLFFDGGYCQPSFHQLIQSKRRGGG